jgi:hypothetical protein
MFKHNKRIKALKTLLKNNTNSEENCANIARNLDGAHLIQVSSIICHEKTAKEQHHFKNQIRKWKAGVPLGHQWWKPSTEICGGAGVLELLKAPMGLAYGNLFVKDGIVFRLSYPS